MSERRQSLRDSLYEVVGSYPAFLLGLICGFGVAALFLSVLSLGG